MEGITTTPIIGITTYRLNNDQGYPQIALSQAYIDSVASAGGLPIMIPSCLSESSLVSLLERIDGVLFTGGGDIEPSRYGGVSHSSISGQDRDRDQIEISLAHKVIAENKPFFGICRGIQVINVAMGGSLYEDIGSQHPDSLLHQYYPNWPRDHLAHPVEVDPESRLASILGESSIQVNSLHHQAVKGLAPGLHPSAHAPDGILEAFELPDHPYGLAVQWHPENLQAYDPMRQLFQSFVSAARGN